MVHLLPMSESDFQIYLARAVQEYADEHVKAGNWHSSEAREQSEKEFQQLLPDGVASQDQYLFFIVDATTGAKVGMIWFTARADRLHPSAFIYDFLIFEEDRRKGYGEQALLAVEEKVKEHGVDTISLHVFGHNHAAQALYDKAGYVVTDLWMSKKISITTRKS